MKAYKIDLSGFTGKVREVVSEAVQKKAAALGLDETGQFCDFAMSYLFISEDDGCLFDEDSSYYRRHKYTAITAADFLALETAKDPEFKPFDRVLVRDYDDGEWIPELYAGESDRDYVTITHGYWHQCIPYEGNEHLVGKTDSPKESN